MPKKSAPIAAKKPKRRQPIKRQRLGGLTVTLQHSGAGFMVAVHHPDGKRTRQRCATEAQGKTAFDLRCREAANLGTAAAAQVGDAERRACSDFLTRTASWHPRPSVADALADFIKRHEARSTSITVSEAIDARLAEARARGLSSRHVKSTESRLKPFKEEYGTWSVADITSTMVQSAVNALPVSATSKGDALRAIHSVFSTALRAGRVSSNPAAGIRPPKSVIEEVGVITAAELGRLLAALPGRSVPAVAIMALAGLRRAEAEKLEWSHVKIDDRVITVTAGVAKTASRRHVPISDALAAWLAPYKQDGGCVAPPPITFRRDLDAARGTAKIVSWPRNCLRHGCASAWCATEPDIAKVAGWLGNSPGVIHAHYKALVTAEEAQAWLAVLPSSPPKRTPRPGKAAAKAASATPATADTSSEPEAASAKIIEFPRAAS